MLDSRQCLSEHGSPAKGCENVIDARTKEMPIWKHARCVREIVKDFADWSAATALNPESVYRFSAITQGMGAPIVSILCV